MFCKVFTSYSSWLKMLFPQLQSGRNWTFSWDTRSGQNSWDTSSLWSKQRLSRSARKWHHFLKKVFELGSIQHLWKIRPQTRKKVMEAQSTSFRATFKLGVKRILILCESNISLPAQRIVEYSRIMRAWVNHNNYQAFAHQSRKEKYV